MLFSATLDGDVGHLIRHYLKDPVEVAIDCGHRHRRHDAPPVPRRAPHGQGPGGRRRSARACPRSPCSARRSGCATRSPRRSSELGVDAAAIHGDLPQVVARAGAAQVRRGQAAPCSWRPTWRPAASTSTTSARSIHYDPPKDAKDYLHRSGRTARAGRDGWAVTLVEYNQHTQMRILQRTLRLPLDAADRGVQQRRPAARPGVVRSRRERMTDRPVQSEDVGGRGGRTRARALARRVPSSPLLGGVRRRRLVRRHARTARRDGRRFRAGVAPTGPRSRRDAGHGGRPGAGRLGVRQHPGAGCRPPASTRRSASTGRRCRPMRSIRSASTPRARRSTAVRGCRCRWSICAGSAPGPAWCRRRSASTGRRRPGPHDVTLDVSGADQVTTQYTGTIELAEGADVGHVRGRRRRRHRRRTAASCAPPAPVAATTTTVPPAGGGEEVPGSDAPPTS